MFKYALFFIIFFISPSIFAQELKLDQLKMPPGFHVSIFANNVKNAREMALGDNGTVFVGSTDAGKVYAITYSPDNPTQHEVKVIAAGLNQPQGVAFYKGDLYVAEVDRIIRYNNIEKNLDNPTAVWVTDSFPHKKPAKGEQAVRHGWKTIHFSPDGKLYVTIGMPCDSCLPQNKLDGTIVRMNPDGSDVEIYAKGVRNSVGFAWQPHTHKLWFTDNGRDTLGDDIPPDKLNYAPEKNSDFGFPYYLGIDDQGKPIPDPHYGKLRSSAGITWEALNLPAHVAVLNMLFYTGNMFPDEYKNQIFVTEHGSWDRSKKVGYEVSLIKIKDDKALSYTPFITGWQKNEKYWGRPAGLLQLPDGSLLVSDDYAGVIYQITYQKP